MVDWEDEIDKLMAERADELEAQGNRYVIMEYVAAFRRGVPTTDELTNGQITQMMRQLDDTNKDHRRFKRHCETVIAERTVEFFKGTGDEDKFDFDTA